jgi:hypothetical protein
MKSSTIERLLLVLGGILLIGYLASIFVPSFESMQENFRLAAIAGIVCYAGYSFFVQYTDQKIILSRDQKLEKLMGELKKERRRADDLHQSHLSLQSKLSEAENKILELKKELEKPSGQ